VHYSIDRTYWKVFLLIDLRLKRFERFKRQVKFFKMVRRPVQSSSHLEIYNDELSFSQSTAPSTEKESFKSRYRGVYRCGRRWKVLDTYL
jgi:hypothetical protein